MEAGGGASGGPDASGRELLDDELLKQTFAVWESTPTSPPREASAPAAERASTGAERISGGGDTRPAGGGVARPAAESGANSPSGAQTPPAVTQPSSTNTQPPSTGAQTSSSLAPNSAGDTKPSASEGSEGVTPSASAATMPAAPLPDERGRRRAAAAGERIAPRVEKLREASMGVLEEASDDTGLRFVLVALALFVLAFVVLLFHAALK